MAESRWTRWWWLRLALYVTVTVLAAWAWSAATAPDPHEVDPEDDGLPVRAVIWLLIFAAGFATSLAHEIWLSRRRDMAHTTADRPTLR
jgi:hypothetical protein